MAIDRTSRFARFLASALVVSGLGLGAPGVRAEIEVYRYTDDDGVVRYTIERAPDGEAEAEAERTPPPDSEQAEPGESTPAPQSEQDASDVVPGSAEDIQRQIERDREALREIVSTQGTDPLDDRNSPRVREIAERLPRLQSELEALQSDEPTP